MIAVPARIQAAWINTLSDRDLLDVESQLRDLFFRLEGIEKKKFGRKYDLFRGPAELMEAWDRWSRVHTATRERSLNPAHPPAGHS